MPITRRDFLNGTALTIATGLTPAARLGAQPAPYPPALTGLRGQHLGSFEAAHALAREGRRYAVESAAIDESYDLVVVGAGISGLAAAWYYRRARPQARILVLDNHDDFGGQAKRNEFTLDGRRIIGYGGSQSLQSPNSLYSTVAKSFLRDLGIDIKRFETAFDREFYPSLGLSRGTFFNREAFGRDVLVTGEPARANADEYARRNARTLQAFVADFPVSPESRAQILALYAGATDPLAGKSSAEKRAILKATSYRDYLI
ncbi:MAG TPA: FAD-dependent oxidoreductase, partial [Xanthobacteraceae bacterium]